MILITRAKLQNLIEKLGNTCYQIFFLGDELEKQNMFIFAPQLLNHYRRHYVINKARMTRACRVTALHHLKTTKARNEIQKNTS